MNSLRVLLYSDGVYNGFKDGFLKYFDSILNPLRKHFDVKEIWLTTYVGDVSEIDQNIISYYNAFNFSDANDVLTKLKPDLVLIPNSQEYISRSLLYAAKYKSIPSAIIYSGTPNYIEASVAKVTFIRIATFSTLGKLFLRKYFFLLKTLRRCGYPISHLVGLVLKDAYFILTSFLTEFKADEADLYICSNNDWQAYALKRGINKNKVVVVGEYAMDHIYEKIKNLGKKTNQRLEILLITSPVVEHGSWTRNMRDQLIMDIVREVTQKMGNTVNLRIKIHPTSERLEDYTKITNQINPKIEVIQKGDLLQIINESDIIITFGQTMALLQVLLLDKPILMLNPYKDVLPYVKEGVAMECKTVNDLINRINDGSYSKIDSAKRQEFISNQTYKFDGRCGERAAGQILSLLKASKGSNTIKA